MILKVVLCFNLKRKPKESSFLFSLPLHAAPHAKVEHTTCEHHQLPSSTKTHSMHFRCSLFRVVYFVCSSCWPQYFSIVSTEEKVTGTIRMHSSRMHTVCYSGHLSCHAHPLPYTPPPMHVPTMHFPLHHAHPPLHHICPLHHACPLVLTRPSLPCMTPPVSRQTPVETLPFRIYC